MADYRDIEEAVKEDARRYNGAPPSLEDDLDELERTDNHLRNMLEQRTVLIQQINEKRAIASKRLDASENFMNEVRGFDSPSRDCEPQPPRDYR